MRQTDILIVGGGIAGLGLAASLSARRPGSVLLVDREGQPGFYASGHNAAIARQLTGRPEHTGLRDIKDALASVARRRRWQG